MPPPPDPKRRTSRTMTTNRTIRNRMTWNPCRVEPLVDTLAVGQDVDRADVDPVRAVVDDAQAAAPVHLADGHGAGRPVDRLDDGDVAVQGVRVGHAGRVADDAAGHGIGAGGLPIRAAVALAAQSPPLPQ